MRKMCQLILTKSVSIFHTDIFISEFRLSGAKSAACFFENFLRNSNYLLLLFRQGFFHSLPTAIFYLDTGSCCRWYHTEKTNCLCAEKSKETSAFSTGSCSNSICNIPFRFSQGSGIYGKHGELHPRYAGICMYS